MNNVIHIIVADDHPVVRDGLVAILSTQSDFKVVADVGNGLQLLEAVRKFQPQVIISDLEMPDMDGVEAIHRIHQEYKSIGCIAFTAFDTDERIVGAVKAGAKGYLLKGAPRDEVFRAIRIVSRGGSLLEPTVATKLLQHMSGEHDQSTHNQQTESLTEREMEVMRLLGTGKTNKEIGAELYITERTVKFYVSAILAKLNAGNRTEAVTIAVQKGLISLEK